MNRCACCGCGIFEGASRCDRCRMECLPVTLNLKVTSCGIPTEKAPRAMACRCEHGSGSHHQRKYTCSYCPCPRFREAVPA